MKADRPRGSKRIMISKSTRFSFVQIGLFKISAISLSLEVLHWALQKHFPGLSPHYRNHRELWVRILLVTEYFFIMTAIIVALSSVLKAGLARSARELKLSGFLLFGILVAVFLFVYR